jgi:phenylalanyl-tRNA synthetase alpha chain
MRLNGIRQRLEAAVDARERALADEELDRRLREEVIDVTLPARSCRSAACTRSRRCGAPSRTPFLGLGYEVRDDREVETVHYNFDQLAFDEWHPARSPRASFFFDDDHVLRTETSPSQIHSDGGEAAADLHGLDRRCYRRDAIDATHYPIFHQFEGLAVDRGLTLADLQGNLLHVMRSIFGPDRRVRFRTHYFPFTEPSMEPDGRAASATAAGWPRLPWSGWLEMGGSGMVDPACPQQRAARPEEWSGFAFGCGIERVAQLRHDFPDFARCGKATFAC